MPLAVRWAAGAGAAVATGIAGFALGTWAIGAWQVGAMGRNYVPMAPSTGLVLFVLGVALVARCARPAGRLTTGLGLAAAAIAATVGGLVGAAFVLRTDPGWERWLAGTSARVGGATVGRMSVLTAGCLVAAAVSLAAQLPPFVARRAPRYLGMFLAVLGLLFGVVTTLAYATATPIFYGVGIVPMALLTALALVGLNFGLLMTSGFEAWRRSPDWEAEEAGARSRMLWGRVVAAAFVAVGVAGAGFLYLRHQQLALRTAIGSELGAIADLKAAQVANWRNERMDDARFLARAPAVARDLADLLAHPDSAERRAAALGWLDLLKGGERYDALAFFDPKLRQLLATPDAAVPIDPPLRALMAEAWRNGEVAMGDLVAGRGGRIRLDIVAAVREQGAAASGPAGLILLRLDPHRFLFPLLEAWPVPSATAETVLVRREGREVVFLSELRDRRDTDLELRRSLADETLPASRALRGEPGPAEGIDYRGMPVLAAYRPIAGTPWTLIAKVDQTEIYAPLRREALTVGLVLGLILLALGLGALVYRRHRRAEQLERQRRQLEGLVEERTAAVAAETSERRRAEAQLRFRSEAEHLLQEISAALLAAGTDETDGTITQVLERLAAFTGADAAYLFTFDADRTHFSQSHLWTSPVLTTRREDLQGLEVAAMPWWMNQILAGREVVVPSVARLPAEAAVEKRIIQSQRVAAVVDVPMMLHGTAVGFIGMNSAREGHLWRLEDTNLLRTLAQVLTSALQRQSVERELRRHRERLEELVAQRTAALHESERRFQVLFEQARVAIGVSRGPRVVFVNPACAQLFGYERPEELAGLELTALVAPGSRAELQARIQQAASAHAGPGESETMGLRRDGSEFFLHASTNRIELADGPATLSFLTDVTGRRQVERALSESEARFHSLFDHSADGILLTIPDGHILAANHAACRMLQRDEAEIIRVGRTGIVDLQDPKTEALIAERRRAGSAQGEMTMIRGDGTRFPVEVSSAIFATGEGQRTSMVIRDITERKRVEAALRESEYFLSRSQAVAALGSYKFEVAAGTWSGTPELDRIFGIDTNFKRDEGGWLSLIVPEDRDMMRRHLEEEVIARRGRFEKEYRIVRHDDGQLRWVFGQGELEFDAAGRPVRMIGVIQDITDRRQAEQALRESELRFRTLVENAPEAVFVGTNPGGGPVARFAYLNAAALRLFGAGHGYDLVGKPIADRVHPDSQALLSRRIRETMEARYSPPQEEVYLRLDGTPIPVEVAAARIEYLGETGAVVFVRDISERKTAAEKIREQTLLLETATDAILVRDLQHRIQYWNKSAERLYGWKAEEVQGRELPELQGLEPAAVDTAFEVVMKTGEWTGEVRQLTRERQEITVLSRWSLVRDEAGRPKSVFVINTDITERKKLESQLYRAQRLESIGQLASGIAHDLNNILAPLVMVSPLLRMEIKTPETLRLVDILENNTKRGVEVVKQILTFSRGLKAGKGLVPARPLLKEILNVLDETFPKSISVQSSIPEDLWMVEGDATQLHQVLMNLCVNARDAMPDGGTLTLAAENVVVDELYASMSPGARPGPYTVWLVADTGSGIPPEILDRIFDPFFTTKEPGKGTGLGLSTVLGIVRSHHGFLKVESRVGKGTQFRVYLPAQIGAQAPTEPATIEPPPRGNGETILVVDDEEGVRLLTKKILEQHGYQVLLAAEGSEAVVAYAQHAGEIQAVVTDLMMPLMDGATLIRALRQIAPSARILATTGVTESTHVAAALRLGAKEVLRKPYSPHVLLRRLRAVLDEPNPPAPPERGGV